MSSDAKYVLAVEDNGNIYASQDGGTTWYLPPDTDVQGNHNWRWSAVSSNGQYSLILEHGGVPYVSVMV